MDGEYVLSESCPHRSGDSVSVRPPNLTEPGWNVVNAFVIDGTSPPDVGQRAHLLRLHSCQS